MTTNHAALASGANNGHIHYDEHLNDRSSRSWWHSWWGSEQFWTFTGSGPDRWRLSG